jgi:hypothetical protein
MTNKQHYLPWIAVWGALFGFIDGIPLLGCCCFLWFGLAGLLSVKSVTDKAGQTLQIGEGVIIGLLTGIVAGLIAGFIAGGTTAALGASILNFYRSIGAPPNLIQQLEASLGNPLASFAQQFCMNVVLGPVLGCLGGLIGTQVFKK